MIGSDFRQLSVLTGVPAPKRNLPEALRKYLAACPGPALSVTFTESVIGTVKKTDD